MTKEQQRAFRVAAFFDAHRDSLARQGTVTTSWRFKAGREYGPYYRLEFRRPDGRKISVFLGADGPLVAAARHRLAELRRPLRQRRALSAAERQLRRGLRAERQKLARELGKIGLHFHGSEIRGYRAAKNPVVVAAPVEGGARIQNPEF